MSLTEKPEACKGCPAYEWGVGFVRPKIYSTANKRTGKLLFIGSGPNESDAYGSQPFHPEDATGGLLTEWLNSTGYQRTQVSLGHIVQCWLPEKKRGIKVYGTRQPTQAEVRHCWNAYVGPWLHSTAWDHIITVGLSSAKWLLGLNWKDGADKYMGTTQKIEIPEDEVK